MHSYFLTIKDMLQVILPALISGAFSAINTAQVNRQNASAQNAVNRTNIALAREANIFSKAESELAFKRSLPSTQVSNMMTAGMSRAGALNAINGGGHYSPAPVNTAQVQAPQAQTTDFSALANVAQILSQQKLADKQLKLQEKENQKNRESAENIARINADAQKYGADTSANTAANRLEFDKEVFEAQKPKLRAEINQIVQNTENLKKIGKGHDLDNIRKGLENNNYPTIAKLANVQSWQSIQYTAMKLAHEDANHMNQQERENLELEFMRAVMDSGISLQNAQNELQSYLAREELSTYNSPIGGFIGALVFAMDKLIPKFASLK